MYFVPPYLNIFPAVEKCYYLSILLKMVIGTVEITHRKSLKDSNCSIAMKIIVVLFRRIHLCVFLWLSHFDSRPRKGLIVTELSKSESERNAIRNDDSVGVFVAFITIIMTFDFIKHKKST